MQLATIVIDKYHVVQKVIQVLDKVRKGLAKLKNFHQHDHILFLFL
ncbi:transposase [Anoxybacillus sp. B2M1]|nr:transposase [Anoxybacillus sp. B2M1]